MKLNCKPGQMAMVVRCLPGYEYALGKTMTVIRISPLNWTDPTWEFEPPITIPSGHVVNHTVDWCLMPIEPDEELKSELLELERTA